MSREDDRINDRTSPLYRFTYEEVLKAVKRRGCVLQYVKDQTPELCLEAVKQNGHALQFVKEQTPEICLAAVERNVHAIYCVKYEYLDVVKLF
ncbi:MAG: DUF4116 domain-containing protein [Porphyromonadaceae bacterium]|nr:DUF4116 domain-containing protein [Porphyromonadaceae bacterium]